MLTEGLDLGGQPLLVQIIISVGIGLSAIFAAVLGYRKRLEREPPGAANTVIASIPDMGAVRHLADVCIELTGAIQALERCLDDLKHHTRNQNERMPELLNELRELRRTVDAINR